MSQEPFNQCIKLNDTWVLEIVYLEDDETTPIDITGRTVRVQVRETADAAAALLDLTDGSGLTVTPAAGQIQISADTTGITAPGDYVWALELGGTITEEIISGAFRVEQDIVRV